MRRASTCGCTPAKLSLANPRGKGSRVGTSLMPDSEGGLQSRDTEARVPATDRAFGRSTALENFTMSREPTGKMRSVHTRSRDMSKVWTKAELAKTIDHTLLKAVGTEA